VPVSADEAKTKLCRVKHQKIGKGGIPYIVTHDGRTIRYPDPSIKVHDTVMVDLSETKITDHVKFEVGNIVMVTGGSSNGRVGVIVSREKHAGGYDIVHIRDSRGANFTTRLGNVFALGTGNTPLVPLPRGDGIRLSIEEERLLRAKTA